MREVEQLEFYPVRVELRQRFRRTSFREMVLIRGQAGWSEFSPFPDYQPWQERLCWQAAVEAATKPAPTALHNRIPVNLTVPAVKPSEAESLVAGFSGDTVKVKIAGPGESFDQDLDRITAVRSALGPHGKIRLDVNGAWTVDQATQCITELTALDIEYVEQPCATIPELVELRQRVTVPIAADESVRLQRDPLQVVRAGGADVLILKTQPLGGRSRLLTIAQQAEIPVVVSSALETSVGLGVGLSAAAALPELLRATGLGTASMLVQDVVTDPLLSTDGWLEVRTPAPDLGLLDQLRPPGPIARKWMEKAHRFAELDRFKRRG